MFVLAGMATAAAGGCEDGDDLIIDGNPDGGPDARRLDGAAGMDVGTGNDVAPDTGEDRWDAGPAQCQQGTVRSFASSTEAVQAMAGRWKYCGGSGPSAFKDEAIEFTAGGQWFQLEPDATGALVRQMSPGKAGQFSLSPTATSPTTAFDFMMTFNNTGSSYLTNMALTANPRRLQLGPDYMMPAD
jgi:hypothetical protein